MEKHLFWKIQAVNASEELEAGSLEMELYKQHYLKDFNTREEMNDVEAQEHYNKYAWKNPIFSKLYSLTLAFVKDNKIRVKLFTGEEKDLLINFVNTVRSPFFAEYTLVCFETEYLLPYLGIRLDKHGILETLPDGLIYRGRKPWNLTSISVRDYYQGAGAYKPSLKELAYIFGINTTFLGKEEISRGGDDLIMGTEAQKEMKTLVNVWRAINKLKPLDEVEMSIEKVENMKLEEPKTLLHSLNESKILTDKVLTKLKKLRVLKKDREIFMNIITASLADIDPNFGKVKNENEVENIKEQLIKELWEK